MLRSISLRINRSRRLLRNVIFDLQFGGFAGGSVPTPFAHLGYHDSINTDYFALDQIFAGQIDCGDVLVDVGCGKGRVLNWWLKYFPENHSYGVERNPDLAVRVKRRLRGYSNVSIIAGDIFDHWPQDATLFYLFNPFGREAMLKFRDRLLQTNDGSSASGKQIRVIYYYPTLIDVFSCCQAFEIRLIKIQPYDHQAAIITFKND